MKRSLTAMSLERYRRSVGSRRPKFGVSRIENLCGAHSKGGAVRVVAVLCLYDDVRFIVALLEELLPRVHHLLVLHRPDARESLNQLKSLFCEA